MEMGPKNLTSITWSKGLAYVVGLMATDGNLSSDRRHMDFTSSDIDLIVTFKRLLGIKNRITNKISGYNGKPCPHIQFGSVVFYKWLTNIGLMPNKSLKLGELKIPDRYFFDFLRGSLDGDGNIRVYNDSVFPNSIRLYTRFASASPAHLTWLRKCINEALGIKGHRRQYGKNIFELSFAKNDSKVLLNAIYYHKYVPCLKRKRKIAEPFLLNK